MNQPILSTTDTKRNRRHSIAFKLALVKQTLQDGASVARIARENGIHANQVFAWRKLYREGLLDPAPATSALLPVTMGAPSPLRDETPRSSHTGTQCDGVIRLECAKGHLIIEGAPDCSLLERILERLLR